MRRDRQGMSNPDVLILLLAAVVVCLAFFGLFLFRKGPHEGWREAETRAQLNAMNMAVELFANEFDAYPPSGANDPTGEPYCGAMKLAEALMGQDLLGFHVKSAYRADGLDPNSLTPLYPPEPDAANLQLRKGPFLQAENANAYRLVDVYGTGNTGSFAESAFVLCDPYERQRPGGKKTGMPILYYRANRSGIAHDVSNPDNPQNIFNYKDNQTLIALAVPGKPGETHPLADPKRFYLNTQNRKTSKSMPSWGDSFILIGAGQDGLYGTADDICNVEWKYRKR
jgi:hypothetical protein